MHSPNTTLSWPMGVSEGFFTDRVKHLKQKCFTKVLVALICDDLSLAVRQKPLDGCACEGANFL